MDDEYLDPEEKMLALIYLYIAGVLVVIGALLAGLVYWWSL